MDLTRVGKYDVLAKIGEGAMGIVWKAHDPTLNRMVAVKMISAATEKDRDVRRRFHREAQSAGQLNHPNIVTVYEFGEHEGQFYLVMELLEGADLKELIRDRSLGTLAQKLRLMEQICAGLAFAHSKSVVHRDLKPSNIHVLPDRQVKILDFGLARLPSSDITQGSLVMGTPHYMSPEQVKGQRAEARSDVFSLGAVFYEMLSYARPFSADTLHGVLFKVAQGDRKPIAELVPGLPSLVVDVVEKALATDGGSRFQDAGEMRMALRSARLELGDTGHTVAPSEPLEFSETLVADAPLLPAAKSTVPPKAKRARWPIYAAVGILVVALGGGGFLFTRQTTPAATTTGPPPDAALTSAVGTSLAGARAALEARDYETARLRAEAVLERAPGQEEATRVRDEARQRLDAIDRAAREARALFDLGKSGDAAQALARLIAESPSHPVVAELASKLDRYFKAEAEDARRRMSAARTAAQKAGGESSGAFAEAAEVSRLAASGFQDARYAIAAQKFLEARDRFERARREADGKTEAERAEAKAALDDAVRRWSRLADDARLSIATKDPAFQSAVADAAHARELADKGDFRAAVDAYDQASSKLVEAQKQVERVARESREVARQAEERAAREREAAAAPPSTSTPEVNEEALIRRVLATYERAIETKDLALYKSVRPSLSRDALARLEASFREVSSQRVGLTIASVALEGARASVRLVSRMVVNGAEQRPREQTFILTKEASGWIISEIQ